MAQGDARSRMNLVLFCLFFGIVTLFGGASRADVPFQAVVRIAAIAMIAASVLQFDRDNWRAARTPVLFILAIGTVLLIQLIPLPPGLWASLPGRGLYVQPLEAAGVADVWRPLSLTPDLTLNSLLALLPPLAAAFGLGLVDRSDQRRIVPVLIAAAVLSAFIGLVQVSNGSLYFYAITNEGSPVGVFSNRNHQALFLAAILPVLGGWAALPHHNPVYRRARVWIAACIAAPIIPILLITGSRAGLAGGIVGGVLALAMTVRENRRSAPRHRQRGLRQRLLVWLPVATGIIAVAAVYLLSRDVAIQRFFEDDTASVRSTMLPVYVQMARDFFPFGSGFGSFDTLFRVYEPATHLGPAYLNHAHNDLAEIIIEGGLLPLLLLVPFLGWFLVRAGRLWLGRLESTEQLLGRIGAVAGMLILLSCLVDYPLRTPLISVLMTISCYWMRDASIAAKESKDAKNLRLAGDTASANAGESGEGSDIGLS